MTAGRRPPCAGPEHVVVLDDGSQVAIRPIRPDDVDRLVAFHEGLTPRTVRLRFFAAHPHLSAGEAEHFCQVDGWRRYALVAVQDDEVVGVARFERYELSDRAEVAFVVADRLQHHGLGRILARRLAAAAAARGVKELVAIVLADNAPMLRLLSDAGFDTTVRLRDAQTATVTCELHGTAG